MKLAVLLAATLSLATAPFQCASEPDPDRRIEDTPSEALWHLAERFRTEGDEDARRTTLRQLVEHYPTSREAERARLVLDGRDVSPDPPPEEEAAEPSTDEAS